MNGMALAYGALPLDGLRELASSHSKGRKEACSPVLYELTKKEGCQKSIPKRRSLSMLVAHRRQMRGRPQIPTFLVLV